MTALPYPKVIQRILAIIVGTVFIYAGFLKARDPVRFATDISNYQMVPWSVGVRFAFYLPWLELICGLALVFHRLIMPDGFSVSLDQFHGLNQIGETGLTDLVNHHYHFLVCVPSVVRAK